TGPAWQCGLAKYKPDGGNGGPTCDRFAKKIGTRQGNGDQNCMAVDFVVVGSGAGGLVGAIAAKLCGLNPVIIEKAAVWGGTSALSGGGVWIPNNPLMQRDKVPDSDAEALAYLEA